MERDILCVQMFGKFSMQYQGRAVAFRKMENAKTIRLLQMLLVAGKEGITKTELAGELYGWDECASARSRSKNLNKLIYRLRDQLAAYGLPREEYVTIRDGICRFESSFPVALDIARFEALCHEAKLRGKGKNLECMEKANELYVGGLLPMNQAETWFFGCGNYYKQMYIDVVRQLASWYRGQEDHKSLVQLYTKVIALYPFEGWQTELMRYYLEWGKQDEALRLYEDTMELYISEMEVPPEEEMQRCFEEYSPKSAKEDIVRALSGDAQWGACYCSYPSFVDYCRIIRRMQYRQQIGGVLMFLSLDRRTREEEPGKAELERQMEILKEAIRVSLRGGDAYTRYGSEGYVLLIGNMLRTDACADIFRRIEECCRRTGKGQIRLRYQAVEMIKI